MMRAFNWLQDIDAPSVEDAAPLAMAEINHRFVKYGPNKTNLYVLKNSGISGLCVVSAIMHANNPKKEAQTLLKLAKQLKSS